MSSRPFDAVLFDAGGIFVVPDPHRGGARGERRPAHAVGAGAGALRGMAAQDAHAGQGAHARAGGLDGVPRGVRLAGGVPGDGGLGRAGAGPGVLALPVVPPAARVDRRAGPAAPGGGAHRRRVERQRADRGHAGQRGGARSGPRRRGAGHVRHRLRTSSAWPSPTRPSSPRRSRRWGCRPDRVAYVGDSVVNDIGGARAAGLHPIQTRPVRRPGRRRPRPAWRRCTSCWPAVTRVETTRVDETPTVCRGTPWSCCSTA